MHVWEWMREGVYVEENVWGSMCVRVGQVSGCVCMCGCD